jgi:eukaryotic-like serine/threonine-protein kinase
MRVGRFQLRRALGRGRLGVTFEARDTELGRDVAFKLIRPGPGGEGLAWRDAEALASLTHPNLVTLFDVGRCPQGPFLVLELLQGRSLAGRLQEGPLPPSEAVAPWPTPTPAASSTTTSGPATSSSARTAP